MTIEAGAGSQGHPSWLPGRQTLVALGWFTLSVALLLLWYWHAGERAVRLWIDTPTYSYAFLIAPLSIYLMVQKAGRMSLPPIAPQPLVLALHLPIGAIWYLAVAAEIVELQQFCLLGAIYVTIAALFGFGLVRAHLVALLLLAFMVPSGQAAVPPLQVLSAKIAVGMLKAFGAPVYLDHLHILMPEASYHVEPGCAGLNFVLATIVLALVVGELFYATLFKKVAVMVALLAAAIISNPVRIFGIVYIDWRTHQTTDIVSDHLTYGWAFFAVVLAVILPIALRFRDDDAEPVAAVGRDALSAEPPGPGGARRLATTAVAGMALAAIFPVAVHVLGQLATREAKALPALPAAIQDLKRSATGDWRVAGGSIAEVTATYAGDTRPPIKAEIALRLAPTPQMRLIDRWPVLEERRFVDIVQSDGGRVALYLSGGIANRTLWATCFLVGGICHPDPGSFRRASLGSLPRNPLAKGGFIVLSQPAPTGASPARPDLFRSLLDAMGQIATAVGPGLGESAR